MAIDLATLLSAKTAQTVYNEMIAGVASAGVRVANWRTGAPYRTFLRVSSVAIEQLYNVAQAFAGSGFLDYATGAWLTLLCKSVFSEDRQPALFTAGTVTLTAAPGAGPYTVAAGSLIVATSGGLRYRSTASVTVPAGGSATVAVTAESPGSKYNVGIGAIDRVISPTLGGLSASNPAVVGGAWITASGADEEGDDRLKARCRAKWGTLGTGSPAAAYVYWALTASAETAKVGVLSNLNAGTIAAQWVTVVLAGAGGPVSDGAVTDTVAYITPRMPTCTKLAAVKASTATTSVAGTVNVRSAFNTPETQAAILAALDALARDTPIGGALYLSQVVATIQDAVPGAVRNVVLASPAADVLLSYAQVLGFSYSLTFVGV